MNCSKKHARYKNPNPTIRLGFILLTGLGLSFGGASAFGQDGVSTGWLPIADGQKYILTKVSIEGVPGVFFVDTGASHTIISPDYAEKLKLGEVLYTSSISDGVGVTYVPYYKAKVLTLENGYELHPTVMSVFKLTNARQATGEHIMGVIGLDTLKNSILDLDFENSRFRICREADGILAKFENKYIRRRGRDDLFVVDLSLRGIDLDLSIDSGSDCCVALEPDDFSKLENQKLLVNIYSSILKTSLGEYAEKRAQIIDGHLMGSSLRGIPISTHQPHGQIGIGFMRCFRMALDVSNSRLYYRARTDEYKGVLQTEFMSGAHFEHVQDGALINMLDVKTPKTPLVRVGAKEGDVVIQIGDYSGKAITSAAVYDVCHKYAGKDVPIQLTRKGKLVYSGPLKLREAIYEFDLE